MSYLALYNWLSLSRILDISNFALSWTIYPVPWSFSTRSKQKSLRISNLDISNFCLFQTNFRSVEQFPPAISNLSQNFQSFSWSFISQISLFFQLPLAQLLQLCRQEWVKTLKANFILFLIEYFVSIFLLLEYSGKVFL